jgi:uncharacterized phosphosugar-binding protein
VLVVISNSGRNPVPIELSLQARQRRVRVIALVNARQATQCASRHASGRNLTQVVDLVLDNGGVPGDACVPVEELGTAVGPVSTVTGTVILQMMVCAAVEKVLAQGGRPELFRSSNLDGDDTNQRILQRYLGRVPHL